MMAHCFAALSGLVKSGAILQSPRERDKFISASQFHPKICSSSEDRSYFAYNDVVAGSTALPGERSERAR
jgi:hypothetical protein